MLDFCVHICLNGHTLISDTHITQVEYCEQCGSQMIDKCPECNFSIKEWDFNGVVLYPSHYNRAAYCKHCGKPYPWTKAAIEATIELVEEEEELDSILKEKLISSLPDIISDTPRTQIAVVRFKKGLLSVGKFTADALRQFVIDFGCELSKKQLGL